MKIFAATRHVPWAPNTPKCVCVCLCLARFQQDLRGHVETRKERGKGEEGKEKRTEEKIRKGREKTPPPQINLWLRLCMNETIIQVYLSVCLDTSRDSIYTVLILISITMATKELLERVWNTIFNRTPRF